MNAIDDKYVMGITNFKSPFDITFSIIFLILISSFFISTYFKIIKKNSTPLITKISLSSIIATILVIILGFAPCIYDTPTTLTLNTAIFHSLLCPNYSNRSYISFILIIGLAILNLLISQGKKNENT